MFIREEALKSAKNDKLGYSDLVKTLNERVLLNMKLPNVFGLYGRWGSGKTTILNFIKEDLEDSYSDDVIVTNFNPWIYEYANKEDIIFALLNCIREALGVKASDEKWAALKVTLFTASGMLLKGATQGAVDVFEIAEKIDKSESLLLEKYQSWVDETLKCNQVFNELVTGNLPEGKKLVVLIDDLDRCLPDNAVVLLEAIKNLMMIPKTLFVVAVDNEVMGRMISNRFHLEGGYGKEYLLKIIPHYLEVPKKKLDSLIDEIIEGHQLKLNSETVAFIKNFLGEFSPHPRKAKYYMQQFAINLVLKDGFIDGDEVLVFVGFYIMSRFPDIFNGFADTRIKLKNIQECALFVSQRQSKVVEYNSLVNSLNIEKQDLKILEGIFLSKRGSNQVFQSEDIFRAICRFKK